MIGYTLPDDWPLSSADKNTSVFLENSMGKKTKFNFNMV
jgi:hypothetical protein